MIFFTVGTGLCGFGIGLYDLALYRAVTGVFAASVMPICLALIGDVFPMERRQQAIGTFMGIAFLGQGLSMAVGGSIAYFVSWRGVFFVYAGLSVLSTLLLYFAGRQAPSKKNPNSRYLSPYVDLIRNRRSLMVYHVVLIEGILIIGSFSYLGAYTEYLFKFNYLAIGLTLTAFGAGAVITGRLVGKIVPKIGRKNTLSLGLISAMIADVIFFVAKMSSGRPYHGSGFPWYRIHAGPFHAPHDCHRVCEGGTRYGHVAGGILLHGRWRSWDSNWRQSHQLHWICSILYPLCYLVTRAPGDGPLSRS